MSGVHYMLTSVSLSLSNFIYIADQKKISIHINQPESLDPLEKFLCGWLWQVVVCGCGLISVFNLSLDKAEQIKLFTCICMYSTEWS